MAKTHRKHKQEVKEDRGEYKETKQLEEKSVGEQEQFYKILNFITDVFKYVFGVIKAIIDCISYVYTGVFNFIVFIFKIVLSVIFAIVTLYIILLVLFFVVSHLW